MHTHEPKVVLKKPSCGHEISSVRVEQGRGWSLRHVLDLLDQESPTPALCVLLVAAQAKLVANQLIDTSSACSGFGPAVIKKRLLRTQAVLLGV